MVEYPTGMSLEVMFLLFLLYVAGWLHTTMLAKSYPAFKQLGSGMQALLLASWPLLIPLSAVFVFGHAIVKTWRDSR